MKEIAINEAQEQKLWDLSMKLCGLEDQALAEGDQKSQINAEKSQEDGQGESEVKTEDKKDQ